MATPSEVQSLRKCGTCDAKRPESEFLKWSIGRRAGQFLHDCVRCLRRGKYPPVECTSCRSLKPITEFDKFAEDGLVCRLCIMADREKYRKECTKCHTVKSATAFHRYGKTGYLYAVCSLCDSRLTASKKRSNLEKSNAQRRRHTQNLKAQAYAAYGGAKCACCGESRILFLTLDHVHNDGAEWRRKHFGGNKGKGSGVATYEWCKRNGYPPIFQVLCWNCQQGKRFNGGICPHQLETCRDYSETEVGSSDPKRLASLVEDDIVRHSPKGEMVQ